MTRTGYVGDGADIVGYPIQVLTCQLCRREWVDATLDRVNTVQRDAARRILEDVGQTPEEWTRDLREDTAISRHA
jgi:hypothetical protein